jgi:hypothetical protein
MAVWMGGSLEALEGGCRVIEDDDDDDDDDG